MRRRQLSSQQPDFNRHSFPGSSKPPGIWHCLPQEDLSNAPQGAGPAPPAAASGARGEQAGPAGSDAANVLMWQRHRAPARALPAQGQAGSGALFARCHFLTAPAVPAPGCGWRNIPAEVPQLRQSGWIGLSRQAPPGRSAFSS